MNWRRKEGRNLRRNGNKTKVGRNKDTGRKGEKEAVIRSTEIERKQIMTKWIHKYISENSKRKWEERRTFIEE